MDRRRKARSPKAEHRKNSETRIPRSVDLDASSSPHGFVGEGLPAQRTEGFPNGFKASMDRRSPVRYCSLQGSALVSSFLYCPPRGSETNTYSALHMPHSALT